MCFPESGDSMLAIGFLGSKGGKSVIDLQYKENCQKDFRVATFSQGGGAVVGGTGGAEK